MASASSTSPRLEDMMATEKKQREELKHAMDLVSGREHFGALTDREGLIIKIMSVLLERLFV